ncbi:MAG: PhzF family phenazine biosynthesis protein [Ignavibacteriaceae bacterium]
MKPVKILQIDAFTNIPFEGNAAAVLSADGIPDQRKQIIAREMNLSETAFISSTKQADFRLQWFTPGVEVDLCGHGTIAAIHYLAEMNLISNNSLFSFLTRSGVLKCRSENGTYFMQIPLYNLQAIDFDKKELLKALRISTDQIDTSVPPVMIDNGKLFLYIKSIQSLRDVSPDFNSLLKLNRTEKYKSVCLYTLETIDKTSTAHLRYFAPLYGINEDPVTGSANGPLLLVLKKTGLIEDINNRDFIFEQGDFMQRKGRILVRYNSDTDELYIAGQAVTVLSGEIFV